MIRLIMGKKKDKKAKKAGSLVRPSGGATFEDESEGAAGPVESDHMENPLATSRAPQEPPAAAVSTTFEAEPERPSLGEPESDLFPVLAPAPEPEPEPQPEREPTPPAPTAALPKAGLSRTASSMDVDTPPARRCDPFLRADTAGLLPEEEAQRLTRVTYLTAEEIQNIAQVH